MFTRPQHFMVEQLKHELNIGHLKLQLASFGLSEVAYFSKFDEINGSCLSKLNIVYNKF